MSSDIKELLELKKRINAKRPRFIRQDAHKWKKLEKKWVRPAGLHSKMRQKRKGQPIMVDVGYRSPREVRGMMLNGFKAVVVFNAADVERLDIKKEAAVVAAPVGMKKRLGIVEAAQKKGVKVLNIKDLNEYKASVNKVLEERRKMRASKLEKKVEVKKVEKKEEKKMVKEEKKKEKTAEEIKKEKEQERLEAEKVIITKS